MKSQVSRRSFLKKAAIGVGMMAGAETLEGKKKKVQGLPTIRLGKNEVSRLIIGANPMAGYSHLNALMSKHMVQWYTTDQICKVLERCLEVGINTWQSNSQQTMLEALAEFRKRGNDIQWICLADNDVISSSKKLESIVKTHKPLAVVHHGGVSDMLWRSGKIDRARDFVKRVRDLGPMAGVSSHNPEVIQHVEDAGWDVDLYMTCFYQVTRTQQQLKERMGSVPLGEVYLPEDPALMCEVVRQVKRPCLGFKILAAGRQCENPNQVREAFRFAYGHIKPRDGVIVGMYPRYRDQVAENAGYAAAFG